MLLGMSVTQPLLAERYRLVRSLGQGGMGRVWLARDEVLHRDVAIKEVVPPAGLTPQERDEMRMRTLREARTAARLNHPSVVRVYDVVRTDVHPWIVMEYVPSRSLHEVIAEDGTLPPNQVAQIGLQVLGALQAAHRAGVLHRDVKPSNVLLTDDGRVVLTDFGLATMPGEATVTRPGMVLGSPAYISPERARDGHAGPESDLWSLGATLYAAVEGNSPYQRSSAIATLTALVTEEPPPARHAGPLRSVLNGLLRKDPATRIDAEEAERRLRRAAGGGLASRFGLVPKPRIGAARPGAATPQPPESPAPLPAAGTPGPVPATRVTGRAAAGGAVAARGAAAAAGGAVAASAAGGAVGAAASGASDAADAGSKAATPAESAAAATAVVTPAEGTPSEKTSAPGAPAGKPPAAVVPANEAPTAVVAATEGASTTASAEASPAKAVQPGASPAKAAAAEASPAKAETAEASPAKGAQPEASPAKAAQAPASPAKATQATASPATKASAVQTPAVVPAGAADRTAVIKPSRPAGEPTSVVARPASAPATGEVPPLPADGAEKVERPAPVVAAWGAKAGAHASRVATRVRSAPKPWLFAAGIAVLAVLALLIVVTSGGGPARKPQAPAAKPTAAATSGAPAAPVAPSTPAAAGPSQQQPTPPPATPALPEGWQMYTDPTGFSVAAPVGWNVSVEGTIRYFRDPNGGRVFGIDQSNQPNMDPVGDWTNQERQRAGGFYRGYQRIRIEPVNYFVACADWEFTYDQGGTRAHVINRGVVTSDHQAYGIWWSTPDSSWQDNYKYFELITRTFKPKP
jgi:hypothetical protein